MSSEPPLPIRHDTIYVREANHRIANQLADLAAQVHGKVRALQDPADGLVPLEAVLVLRDVVARITALGNHHRRLAESRGVDRVELGEYLVESCANNVALLSLNERLGVNYRLDGGCVISGEVAHALALVVNEIILNSAKHAHPTGLPVAIGIACTNLDGRIMLEVDDDGVGLPEGFDPATDGNVGFQLIRALAAGAGADLSIQSDSLGVTFQFSLTDAGHRCGR